MTSNTLFLVVFLGQIYSLSVYLPGMLVRRIDYVLNNYPESTHPKLYPKSMEHAQNLRDAFHRFHMVMVVLGLAVIWWLGWGRPDPTSEISMWWSWSFFMLQTLPAMVLEIYGFKTAKYLKAKDKRTSKKAVLKRRNLFDYVSPWLVGFTVALFLAFCVFAGLMYDDNFALGSNSLAITLVLLVGNLIFAIIIMWNLYGKKLDPFLSDKDRHRLLSFAIRSLLYQSILLSIFMAVIVVIDVYELKSSLAILMSLFLQSVGLMSSAYIYRQTPLESIDFDVYLADPNPSNPNQSV